jgi:hypothetical protein
MAAPLAENCVLLGASCSALHCCGAAQRPCLTPIPNIHTSALWFLCCALRCRIANAHTYCIVNPDHCVLHFLLTLCCAG